MSSRLLMSLVKRLVNPLKIVTWALRAAGNGSFGPAVQKVYWTLAGKKGLLIALVTAVGAFLVELQHSAPADCAAISCSTVYEYLCKWAPVILGALTVSALDDAVRQNPPAK